MSNLYDPYASARLWTTNVSDEEKRTRDAIWNFFMPDTVDNVVVYKDFFFIEKGNKYMTGWINGGRTALGLQCLTHESLQRVMEGDVTGWRVIHATSVGHIPWFTNSGKILAMFKKMQESRRQWNPDLMVVIDEVVKQYN